MATRMFQNKTRKMCHRARRSTAAPCPDGRQHERVTLGYAIVHLPEAFIYNDNRNLVLGDVDQLRDVEAALLGLGNTRR